MPAAMTPDEWENYCHNLCRLRHGEQNYQKVPDHDRGDLGIEGFSLDGTGCVYQFYVAEATDTAGRFKAQQRKITTDLAKLGKYDASLVTTLGFRIKRWILVVPEYDTKRIVEHATAKGKEIASLRLQCVDAAAFRVLVQDESDFEAQRSALLASGVATATIAPVSIRATDVQEWEVDNAAELAALDEKLRRLIGHHARNALQQATLRQKLLKFHLAGQNYAEQLEDEYPELYEQFAKAKATEESDLEVRSLTTGADPKNYLDAVRRQYENRLVTRVPGLAADDARLLSWAGVAEWMVRCPLDFPEPVA